MWSSVEVRLRLWLQAEEKDPPEPANIRLMGGATHCAGGLEMKLHNDWKPVDDLLFDWNLRTAAVSVRLVNGTTLCSGGVEVKADQSWSSVCKGDFDWQDAEVVCKELGCGAPLKLQQVFYGNITALEGSKEFKCRGNETTLLDCESYESTRNTCSPAGLTCSEPDNVRLVEGGSRCTGRLEMKLHGDWKPVDGLKGGLKSATLVCRKLKCGFAVSTATKPSAAKSVWGILSSRIQSGSALREHVSLRPWHSSSRLEITCSDLLFQPSISISPSIDGVYESSDFTISCSIKPQYPGGSFQLTFTTSNTTQIYTQKAVNHTANFLFPDADHGHQGNYSCVYHVQATRGQQPRGQENLELDYNNLWASRGGMPKEEETDL
ncbi:deleted in malignant brain tumors 1 protein-like [Chelmon rostratus]|uniref:deleted in malignant brain tumors 1 protein-like n=1 Tax=Chelmon rostratus TaxID=109905 RepID=UPI001BE4E803|nr:deleted in malignant brain tumors 1 protein-like [Chelmon rostratus]